MVGRTDSTGAVTQYFYADQARPHLVTHAFKPREGALTSMVYDNQDRLIFAQVDSAAGNSAASTDQTQTYYVVTDKTGSPVRFYTTLGTLVRRVTRLPYGHVTEDTNPNLGVPLGYGGAIYDPEAKLLHFQVLHATAPLWL